MQTLLLLSFSFGLLVAGNSARLLDDRCGLAVARKIFNGGNAEPEASAWMAAVRNETQFLCGGTLIHKRFVLTAAHCLDGQNILFIKLQAYNLSRPVVEYMVSHMEIHRGYSRNTVQNDIGLLKLPVDIVFTAQIYPICINLQHPTRGREVEYASTFDAYGWGKTQTANISEILQRVTLHNYNRNRCNIITLRALTQNQICAGSSNGDTCLGDSGGPLIKELNYNGIRRLTQLGMVSYGLRSCGGLGIYTDITSYADWIEEKINAQFPEDSSMIGAVGNPFFGIHQTDTTNSGSFEELYDGASIMETTPQFLEDSLPPLPTVNPFFGIHQTGTANSGSFGELYDDDTIEKPTPHYREDSWQPLPTAIVEPIYNSPPTETAIFGADNFGQARLLFEPCGTSLSTRIAGGNNAEPEAAAWMAGVRNDTDFLCGGTVIHRRYVLTAANCIKGRQEEISVKLGAYDMRRSTIEFSVSTRIIHEEYDPKKYTHDIGLLQLSRDIQFSWDVYPICIILNPKVKSKVENSYTFDAYGWGRTHVSQLSNLLQKITLDRYDRSECNKVVSNPLLSSQICAGASVGDTCGGDSGGPLTKKVFINGLQRQTQFGITSFGSANCAGIGVYTDVTSYADWIVQKVRGLRQTT